MATTISKNLIGGVLGETIDQSGVNTYAERLAATLPGNRVLIDTQTASTSASLDFTTNIDSTFDVYVVEAVAIVPATDGVDLYSRLTSDGGSTWISTSTYDTGRRGVEADAGAMDGNHDDADAFRFFVGAASNVAAEGGINGNWSLYNLATAVHTSFLGHIAVQVQSDDGAFQVMGGTHDDATAMDGIQFFMSSGNIASGTINLYGIKK